MLNIIPWDDIQCSGADIEIAVKSVATRHMTERNLANRPLRNTGIITRKVTWDTTIQWCCRFLSREIFS